jgi:hypothetical protein
MLDATADSPILRVVAMLSLVLVLFTDAVSHPRAPARACSQKLRHIFQRKLLDALNGCCVTVSLISGKWVGVGYRKVPNLKRLRKTKVVISAVGRLSGLGSPGQTDTRRTGKVVEMKSRTIKAVGILWIAGMMLLTPRPAFAQGCWEDCYSAFVSGLTNCGGGAFGFGCSSCGDGCCSYWQCL